MECNNHSLELIPCISFIACIQISQVHNKSAKLHAKAKMADFKLTFVPLIFLVLRMWGFILSIPHYYLPFSSKAAFRKTTYNAVLVLLAVSVHEHTPILRVYKMEDTSYMGQLITTTIICFDANNYVGNPHVFYVQCWYNVHVYCTL